MSDQQEPTFKDLLERHNITFLAFFEDCLEVPISEIPPLYYHNQCLRWHGERMIAHLNQMANTNYTLEDIYLEQVFG